MANIAFFGQPKSGHLTSLYIKVTLTSFYEIMLSNEIGIKLTFIIQIIRKDYFDQISFIESHK